MNILAYGQLLGGSPFLQNRLFALRKANGNLYGKDFLRFLVGSGQTKGATSPPGVSLRPPLQPSHTSSNDYNHCKNDTVSNGIDRNPNKFLHAC